MSHTVGKITGALLAGGKGRRMDGRDKGLIEVAGRRMIDHALARFSPQVEQLVIVANRNLALYRTLGVPVINDDLAGFAGPLAGIAAALAQCPAPWLAVAPCDSPFMPLDFVARLVRGIAQADAEIGVASVHGRTQPVFAVISTALAPSLDAYLDEGGRKIDTWYMRNRLAQVDFSSEDDAFMNINTAEHQALAEHKLRST